jgi:hypothetical protein
MSILEGRFPEYVVSFGINIPDLSAKVCWWIMKFLWHVADLWEDSWGCRFVFCRVYKKSNMLEYITPEEISCFLDLFATQNYILVCYCLSWYGKFIMTVPKGRRAKVGSQCDGGCRHWHIRVLHSHQLSAWCHGGYWRRHIGVVPTDQMSLTRNIQGLSLQIPRCQLMAGRAVARKWSLIFNMTSFHQVFLAIDVGLALIASA